MMEVPQHHVRQTVCATRLPYREGRNPKAVKVYTVLNESHYIIIQGVPSVGAGDSLRALVGQFGVIDEHHALDEYPCPDKFTEVYLFKFKRIQSARFAKKKLDDYSFFGGCLHVYYAPEYETVKETREKLHDRQRVVSYKIKQHAHHSQDTSTVRRPIHHNQPEAMPTHLNEARETQPMGTAEVTSTRPKKSLSEDYSASLDVRESVPQPQQSVSAHPFLTSGHASMTSSAQLQPQTYDLPAPPREHGHFHQGGFFHGPAFYRNRPPPKSHSTSQRVPSSHATLPEGYDGRLNPPHVKEEILPHTDSHENKPGQNCRQVSKGSSHVSAKRGKTTTPLIVKEYKGSGPTPKFVPRQAVKRKADEQTRDAKKSSQQDPIDQKLRRNAYKLGKVQGPEHVEERLVPPVSVHPNVEKSMVHTIKSIRSKISQVISSTVKVKTST